MNRRDFITHLGGAAAAWPLVARAQQLDGMRRVAVLLPYQEGDSVAVPWIGAFRERLLKLGWSEGRNLRIESRWTAGDQERLRGIVSEIVRLAPDVILANSTPVVAALKEATRTIPIVFEGAQNPVGSGFVASLARPGGNITGFVSFEPTMGGKWLEMLREIVPGVARAGLIYNPLSHTGQYFESIETASRSLSVKAVKVPFRDAAEIERGIEEFAREPNGGLLVLPDSSNTLHRDLIIRLALRRRVPAVYCFRYYVDSGGLAYYGPDRPASYTKAAEYVDRILKGEKPADLPVQAPTKFEIVINLKTAKALGLDIPATVLTRADEVIE
jgi:putative ABC transport system substrate-binding protein